MQPVHGTPAPNHRPPHPARPAVRALRAGLLGLAAAAASGLAQAAIEVFQGTDAGLGENVRLAAHPQADAARAAFLARLVSGIATESFEGIAASPPSFEWRELTLGFGATTARLSGLGLVMDSPAPSTANPVNGIPSGVYPISGTRAWLSADDFELAFTAPQVALGFYGVDIGDYTGRLVIDLVHADATTTRLFASAGSSVAGGAVQYFGVLSVDRPFVAVRFGNTAPSGYDGFAFDELTVADATQLAAVPEPQTWLMWLAGFGLMGGLVRRRSAA